MTQNTAERNQEIASSLANNLPRLLRELSSDFERQICAGLAARGHPGIRSAHNAVLANLGMGAVRVTDLAERGRVTQQAMGKMLRELEGMGYLSRDVDSDDKRAREIRLTERGEQLVADCQTVIDGVQHDYALRAGADQLLQLEQNLREIIGRLDLTCRSRPIRTPAISGTGNAH